MSKHYDISKSIPIDIQYPRLSNSLSYKELSKSAPISAEKYTGSYGSAHWYLGDNEHYVGSYSQCQSFDYYSSSDFPTEPRNLSFETTFNKELLLGEKVYSYDLSSSDCDSTSSYGDLFFFDFGSDIVTSGDNIAPYDYTPSE